MTRSTKGLGGMRNQWWVRVVQSAMLDNMKRVDLVYRTGNKGTKEHIKG